MRALLLALLLTACAAVPPGTRAVNPNCIFRCSVSTMDTNAPKLGTLTVNSTTTGGSKTTTTSTTTSN